MTDSNGTRKTTVLGLDEAILGMAGREKRTLVAGDAIMTQVYINGTGKTSLGGLDEINYVIAAKAQKKLAAGRPEWATYGDALRAVAMDEPDLFLTKARLELDAVHRNEIIYFDCINGQLVNPAVMQDGQLVPLESPLDSAPLNPAITPEQEMAIRVASKMNRIAASDGRKLTYTQAVRLVASENPNLLRRRERATLR